MASDLFERLEADGWRGAKADRMIAWQEGLKRTLGIAVPAVGFGTRSDFPPGAYTLLLHGIPFMSGTISPFHRFSPTSPDALIPLGVAAAGATHPATEAGASWVELADWLKVIGAGYELWDISEYPLRQLEHLAVAHAHELIGHHELAELLAQSGPGLRERIERDGLTAFVQTIRALLSERVPLTAFAEITEEFMAARAEGLPPVRIVERLRAVPAVRAQLPGADALYSRYRLSERAEAELAQAIRGDNDRQTLGLRPARYRRALRSIEEVVSSDPRAALVVERSALRPWLRALTSERYRRVPVLAREELTGEQATGDMKEIDLWPESPSR